jgi:hypothetical protein
LNELWSHERLWKRSIELAGGRRGAEEKRLQPVSASLRVTRVVIDSTSALTELEMWFAALPVHVKSYKTCVRLPRTILSVSSQISLQVMAKFALVRSSMHQLRCDLNTPPRSTTLYSSRVVLLFGTNTPESFSYLRQSYGMAILK